MLDFRQGKTFQVATGTLWRFTELILARLKSEITQAKQVINSDAGKDYDFGDVKRQQRGQESEKTEDSRLAYQTANEQTVVMLSMTWWRTKDFPRSTRGDCEQTNEEVSGTFYFCFNLVCFGGFNESCSDKTPVAKQ